MFEGGTAATNVLGFKGAKDLVVYGGITHSSTGSTGNGTTGYFDTGYTPSGIGTQDMSMGAYGRNSGANDGYIMGSSSATPTYTYFAPRTTMNYTGIGTASYNPANSSKQGRFIINRLATAYNVARNGSISSTTVTNGTDSSTVKIYALALHENTTVSSFSNQELGFMFIGKALTTTQIGQFDTAMATLFTALSR